MRHPRGVGDESTAQGRAATLPCVCGRQRSGGGLHRLESRSCASPKIVSAARHLWPRNLPRELHMSFPRLFWAPLLSISLVVAARGQEPPMPQLSPGSARKTLKGDVTLVQPQSVTLAVPKGTPLQ